MSFVVTTADLTFRCPGCEGLIDVGDAMAWVVSKAPLGVPYTPLCWACARAELEKNRR